MEGSGHKSPRATGVSTCLWPGHLLQLSRGSECLAVLVQPPCCLEAQGTPSGRSNDPSGLLKAAGQRQKVNNRHGSLGVCEDF